MIGKHQSVAAEADERFLDEKGIPWHAVSPVEVLYIMTGEILT